MFIKTNTIRGLALIVALVATLAIVIPASAGNTKPKVPAPPVQPAPTTTTSTTTNNSTTTVIENESDVAQVASSSASKSTLTILSYEMANGLPKAQVAKAQAAGQCRWIGDGTDVPTYWNSGEAANGSLFWFIDHRHVYECNMRKVKCGNLLRFTAPKSHIVKGIVVLVKSLGKFAATIHASAKADAAAWCGKASASASASATMSGRSRLEARGNAKLVANVKATMNAWAKASANVFCGQQSSGSATTTETGTKTTTTTTPTVTPPVTPPAKPTCQTPGANNYGGPLPCTFPPPAKPTCQDTTAYNYGGPLPCMHHTTSVTCTGFEEIFGAEALHIVCTVTSDTGGANSIKANSLDGNTSVSGINCFSENGVPSCSHDGTYEFLVTGNNNGSTTLTSSVQVIATANGVSDTFTSDSFNVDPIGGGF